MKKQSILFILMLSSFMLAQVGINTNQPNTSLEIKSQPNNKLLADGVLLPKLTGDELKSKDNLYNSEQKGAQVYITSPGSSASTKTANVTSEGFYYFDGEVWVKFGNKSNAKNGLTVDNNSIKLGGSLSEPTVINTSNLNNLKLLGLSEGQVAEGKVLIIDSEGVIKTASSIENDLSIPSPTFFLLENDIQNFLENINVSGKSLVPMTLKKNTIDGLSYNKSTGTITFPKGTYQISFVYEADHNATGCTISSYLLDFPTASGTQRIHTTSTHNQGSKSNHGGSIIYTTTLQNGKTWK